MSEYDVWCRPPKILKGESLIPSTPPQASLKNFVGRSNKNVTAVTLGVNVANCKSCPYSSYSVSFQTLSYNLIKFEKKNNKISI